MYKQLKARSNQFSAKIISILRTSYYRPRGGTGERGNGGCWGGGSHGLKGEWKGDQSSPTEYKWRTMEN